MIVKKLEIEKFRGLHNFSIDITTPINLIVGQNGTMKTTLLGIIAQPFSTKTSPFSEETRLDGYKFGSQLSDTFKFSATLDLPGEHKWTLTIDKRIYDKEVYTCLSERRTDNGRLRFWSTEGRESGMNFIQCPVIYLSLKRLIPIGEERQISSDPIVLTDAEKDVYVRKYKEILIAPSDEIQELKHIKGSSKSTVVPQTGTYDELTVSAGQDNVGKILLSVLSLARLKNNYPNAYRGGIIFIDELESTLYPAAQEKLSKFLFEAAQEYKIQFFCTTHSFEIIKYIKTGQYKDRGSIFYLKKTGDGLSCIKNPNLPDMVNDLNVAVGKKEKSVQVKIYCEDDVGCLFANKLIPSVLKNRVKFMSKVNLSWGSYKTFYHERIPEFINNIICLDGDVRNDPDPKNRWNNCPKSKNILFLPGEYFLERLLYEHLKNKRDDDPFWDSELGGYSKQVCFRDYPSELKQSDHIKQWYKSQKENAGRGYSKFINDWKKYHVIEVAEFQSDLIKAYNFLADKNGFEKVDL